MNESLQSVIIYNTTGPDRGGSVQRYDFKSRLLEREDKNKEGERKEE